MSNNFFEVKNVDFNVGGITKVKNVSFSIKNEGDVICLLGPSGIGKTTILRTIAGLEQIDKGSIELNNKTLSSKKINFIHQKKQLGTAHAVKQALPFLKKNSISLILYGDVPLVQKTTLKKTADTFYLKEGLKK